MSQKCCDDCKVHYKLAMGGAPQGAMRVTSQIWQVVFALQTLQVFCFALHKKAQYVVVILSKKKRFKQKNYKYMYHVS